MLLASSAAAQPVPQKAGWLALLRETCPEKRFDHLNMGLVDTGIEAFREDLPDPLRARLERRAQPGLDACEAGVGCTNSAFIRAARELGLMRRLARAICRMPYRCSATGVCHEEE